MFCRISCNRQKGVGNIAKLQNFVLDFPTLNQASPCKLMCMPIFICRTANRNVHSQKIPVIVYSHLQDFPKAENRGIRRCSFLLKYLNYC